MNRNRYLAGITASEALLALSIVALIVSVILTLLYSERTMPVVTHNETTAVQTTI
jgi:hypothetical protein